MPGAQFLTYDPKDVIIVIGGFMFGPLAALLMSASLAFLQMVTHSQSGYIGMIMNLMSSATFACTAAFIYHRKRSIAGAFIGLVLGIIVTTSTMMLWNYFIIPLYMPNISRQVAGGMLVPIIMPFNLIKGGLNAAMILIVYKPITNALKAAKLYNPNDMGIASKGKFNIGVMLTGVFVLICLILLIVAVL